MILQRCGVIKNSLLYDNELMRLLTEIGSCRIIGGEWLGCRFMVSGSSFGLLYGLYRSVPFDKSKVMSRKLVLSWLA